MKTKTKLELAAGAVAAAGALGAAYYFYGTKNAKKHRKDAVAWMVKAEKEIVKEAGKLKDAAFNEKNYKAIVSTVVEKYKALPKVDAKDLTAFKKALHSSWKEFNKAGKKAKPAVKRVAKKASKTVSRAKKAVKGR